MKAARVLGFWILPPTIENQMAKRETKRTRVYSVLLELGFPKLGVPFWGPCTEGYSTIGLY